MSNVLDQHRQQQIVALGRLGWSLRRIEETTGVRRETVSESLKAAGIPVRGRGGRPRVWPPKPATTPEVSTDSGGSKPAFSGEVSTDSDWPKPATRAEVSTDLATVPRPGRAPSASACEPYRELIERALERGRNSSPRYLSLPRRLCAAAGPAFHVPHRVDCPVCLPVGEILAHGKRSLQTPAAQGKYHRAGTEDGDVAVGALRVCVRGEPRCI